jgi:23S rRNA (cytidine1920-2'-O)/16S rRNA (cytidine1409-2'-O)-methyltransferase
MTFASRAGQKLEHALLEFEIDVTDKICADLGCSTGGFTDCLLQHGAKQVFAVDTGYGVLDWKLRNDARVVVMERTNAMHVELPLQVDVVTIDVAWTRQRNILPSARRVVRGDGLVISLIKPHYESHASQLRKGILPDEKLSDVMVAVEKDITASGFDLVRTTVSPIRGAKGNTEMLAWLRPRPTPAPPLPSSD